MPPIGNIPFKEMKRRRRVNLHEHPSIIVSHDEIDPAKPEALRLRKMNAHIPNGVGQCHALEFHGSVKSVINLLGVRPEGNTSRPYDMNSYGRTPDKFLRHNKLLLHFDPAIGRTHVFDAEYRRADRTQRLADVRVHPPSYVGRNPCLRQSSPLHDASRTSRQLNEMQWLGAIRHTPTQRIHDESLVKEENVKENSKLLVLNRCLR
jgi:hypothetical protein